MWFFMPIISKGAVTLTTASAGQRIDFYVRISFLKAGWVIGGTVRQRHAPPSRPYYRVSVGGLSYGFTFGGCQTYLQGRVHNIFQPSDIEGIYGAGSAGAAIIRGPRRSS